MCHGWTLFVALSILIPAWVPAGAQAYERFATVAFIDGQPVAAGELKIFFDEIKGATFAYFHRKYAIEYSDGFWTETIGGEIPLHVAVDNAVDALKKIKVEQILLKERRIVSDITYKAFLRDLSNENSRRSKSTQVIYGPRQYSEEVYYFYLHSNRMDKLKELFSDSQYEKMIYAKASNARIEILKRAYIQMRAVL